MNVLVNCLAVTNPFVQETLICRPSKQILHKMQSFRLKRKHNMANHVFPVETQTQLGESRVRIGLQILNKWAKNTNWANIAKICVSLNTFYHLSLKVEIYAIECASGVIEVLYFSVEKTLFVDTDECTYICTGFPPCHSTQWATNIATLTYTPYIHTSVALVVSKPSIAVSR
jgi:hypothetical protein